MLSNKTIIKAYNNKLRWQRQNHDNIEDIFIKEISILEKINTIRCASQLISYDKNKMMIKMRYMGRSLYDNFALPDDWEKQINDIFSTLTQNNIYYPEFNTNNIVVMDDIISFVDFGLANFNNDIDNENNCKIFVKLLSILNDKFKKLCYSKQKRILYNTFINNLRNEKKYPKNIY